MAGDGQRFCLKWNDFRNSVTAVFEDLRQDEELVDITLCCEGKKVKAHRMMLSACSPYFRDLLKENPCQHPVFFLKDTTYSDLRAVIEFVYNGEVNVAQAQLSSFLKTAKMLQVRGLTGDDDKDSAPAPPSPRVPRPSQPPAAAAPQRPFSRPAPAPVPASRQLPPLPARRPVVPSVPPPPNSVSADPLRPAPSSTDSPPASPASKRRRRLSGSGSSSNDGVESSAATTAAAASPAATFPAAAAAGDGAPPPPAAAPPVPAAGGAPSSGAASDTAALAAPSFGQSSMVKVEKIDIDIADDDEDLAALGQVVDYEGSYDSNQSLGSLPITDASQVGGIFAAAGPSDGGAGSGYVHQSSSASLVIGWTCDQCGKKFVRKSALCAHKKVHTGETTCEVCFKVFSNKTNLKIHVESIHRRT